MSPARRRAAAPEEKPKGPGWIPAPKYSKARAVEALVDLEWFARFDLPSGACQLRREVAVEEGVALVEHVVKVLATNPGELSDPLRRRLRSVAKQIVAVAAGGYEP